MSKDFDNWNEVKKNLNNKQELIFFKEREIYWSNVGQNVGFEQDGKGEDFTRPLLVFKKFSKHMFFGIPLSTQRKVGSFFFEFSFKENQFSTALLVQTKLYDVKRLDKKIGKISVEDFTKLKRKFKELINVE